MVFDKIYSVDWKKLVELLTPHILRKPNMLAWLNAFVAPFNLLHTDFLYYRKYINYRLGITPQVVYLEKLLNDRFDISQRRIRIVKGVEYPPVPLFTKAENKPIKLYQKIEDNPQVLYTKSETAIFTVDFIIKIPVFVLFDMNELIAYINDDVLPSKTYKVQIV